MPDYIVGNEEFKPENDKKTQVYYATYNMEGGAWKRSSIMNRSFISFTYDGKPIEDFNFIATIQNDRMQRNAYASFEDSTTNYETIDGQFYWGTHFTNNGITFSLATDGITEEDLNKFKRWFKPGQNKELVLEENPNRAILARVAAVPYFSLLPFEEPAERLIEGRIYKTSTTLYKGEVTLSFTMDEPFWYSRAPLIKYYYTNEEDKFGSLTNVYVNDENTQCIDTLTDKDMIKVMIEDNIPYVDTLRVEAILSDNTYAILHGNGNDIASQVIDDIVLAPGQSDSDAETNYYAHTNNSDEANPSTISRPSGMVGVILNEGTDSIYSLNLTLSNAQNRYLFYSGTAPAKPIIKFSLKPRISNSGIPYIICPYNTYAKSSNDENGKAYNTLTIGDAEMRFTLPSVWLGYNQALYLVYNFTQNQNSIEELHATLIAGVNEYYARAWAIYCLETLTSGSTDGTLPNNFTTNFYTLMSDFIDTTNTANFTFDSRTGMATAEIPIKKVGDNNFTTINKMVGDMLRSSYIQITGRNFPHNEYGYIDIEQCTEITTNYPATLNDAGLINFLVDFKNMYY